MYLYQYVIKKQIGPSRAFLEKKPTLHSFWPAQIAIQERVKEASLLLFFSGMQDRRKVLKFGGQDGVLLFLTKSGKGRGGGVIALPPPPVPTVLNPSVFCLAWVRSIYFLLKKRLVETHTATQFRKEHDVSYLYFFFRFKVSQFKSF